MTYREGWRAAIEAVTAEIEELGNTRTVGDADSMETRYFRMGQGVTIRNATARILAMRDHPTRDGDPPSPSGVEPPTRLTPVEQHLAERLVKVEEAVKQLQTAELRAGEKLLADRIAKTQAEIELMEKDLDVKLAIARQKISESLDKTEHQARIMRDIAPRYRKRKKDHE